MGDKMQKKTEACSYIKHELFTYMKAVTKENA
jgi:hypothetical protein